jgi:glycosyltransferase involved in cell wall biosynthesis
MKNVDKPLVSVVLCFYNEEKFLQEAVDSVFAQDYRAWELILVDDGSSDHSTAIARKLAANHPYKVRYVHHPGHCNEGLSASRNLGISKAEGDYVAFLDADDVWMADKLSCQIDIFKKNPGVAVVLEASLYWNSWATQLKPDVLVPVGVKEGTYQPPKLMLQLYPLATGSAPCPSGIMVQRSVLERCEFEDSFKGIYQMYEDQAFLCKVYLKEMVYVSSACHNKYRQRPSSLVSSVVDSGKYHMVRRYYLQWFSGYLRSQRTPYRRVKAMLNKARMQYNDPLKYRLIFDFPRFAKSVVAKVLVKLGILTYSKA